MYIAPSIKFARKAAFSAHEVVMDMRYIATAIYIIRVSSYPYSETQYTQ